MAVEIPVVVDIDQAFQDAAKRVSTAIKPLQEYVDSEALKIRLQVDENSKKNLGSILKDASLSFKQLNTALSDVERRLQKLASRKGSFDMASGLTDKENQLIQTYTILQRRITGVGNTSTATQKIISLNISKVKKEIDTLSAKLKNVDKGSVKFNNLNNKLVAAKKNLASLNVELAKVRAQDSLQGLESSLTRSNSRLVTLLKNSARLIALHSAGRFIKNVREVTAEFEMQRVALGGIIQDTEQANQLFRQIKAAAIESPFQIKELVSYTKQLSAYRIETDSLFDVTKRLADVSAGLGVDMGRVILAYGQVRAASVLRGQELRQFTEAGIPLVELLAKKFTELNGRMTSTAEVFDLISKRAVPFEMISEIFEDMTDKGGVFYKMQEKQAETLAGQWSNLKDAASIMYDEIGNTTAVHKGMTALISDARSLMSNWRQVGSVIGSFVGQFIAFKVGSLFVKRYTVNVALAEKAELALTRAHQMEAAASGQAIGVRKVSIWSLEQYAKWTAKAAVAQTAFGAAMKKMVAFALGGGGITLIVSAVATLVTWFISARREANRLTKDLEKIGSEGATSINRSVSNFERLANAAVEAADGSDEQVQALEELQRTYGDIIPSQKLQITYLENLKGNYEELTSAIEQKINMQIREQKINAATDFYAGKIQKGRKKSKNVLEQYGLDKDQMNAVLDEINRLVDAGMLGIGDTMKERARTIEDIIKRLTGLQVELVGTYRYGSEKQFSREVLSKAAFTLNDLVGVYVDLNKETDSINKEMNNAIGTMGVYSKSWSDLQKQIKGVTVSEEEFGKKGSFSYKKEKVRKEVEMLAQAIEEAFKGTNIDISEAFDPKGTINFKFLSEAAESTDQWGLTGYIKNIQKAYESLVPTNAMVGVVERKFQEIAATVGLTMNDVQGYLLRGETDMRDYAKEVKSSLEEAQDKVKELQQRAEDYSKHPGVALPVSDEDMTKANAMVKFFEALSEFLNGYAKQNKGGAHRTDPFITQMQERMKFMQDFKKGYDDLRKYMTSSQALSEEAGVMLGRGTSLGMSAEEQARAASDLSKWYDDAIKAVQDKLKAKGVKGVSVTDFLGIDTTKKSKDIQDLQKLLQSLWDAKTDFDISQKKKDLEDALKKLSDEIKRSETARNFYNDILDLTGDEQLAATLGVSIYGDVGSEFKDRLQAELNKAMETVDASAMTDELRQAFSTQNFSVILANLDKFPEEWQKRLKEMAASSEKFQADRAKELLKSLEKFKSYGERQVELSKQTARRTADIQAMEIPDSTKKSLLEQNTRKQAEESAKIAYEAFRDTPMYIELFDDLDAASGRMLENMRKNLEDMRENWKALSPRELKELQSKINDLDEQIARKNPFKALVASIQEYRDLQKETSRSEAENAAITANDKMIYEKEILEQYQKQYEEAVAKYGIESKEAKQAAEDLEVQSTITDLAIEEAKAAQKTASAFKEVGTHILQAAEKLQEWAGYVSDSLDGIGQIVSTFASDDVSETFDIIAEGIGKTIGGAAQLGKGIAELIMLNPQGIVDTIQGLGSMISGIFGTKSQLSIKAINKKIDEQDRLLSQLTYSYGRLESAMAKAFGLDYIYNYNEQLKNLQAQQAAYEKQAELESQKGKKKDEQKIEEYKQSAKEVEDQMLDMRGQLAEFFAGSDLTSAAEDFANAWIDAYMEFGSTTDAISEKFKDMVNNMIVKSLAGKAMQNLLRPIFDEIDSLAIDGELTAAEIGRISAMATAAIPQINDAMTGLMNNLTTAGIDLRTHAGQFTGISRDIAGASEESILGLAAAVNTANFYISHVPAIAENVAAIRGALVGDTPANVRTTASEGPTYEDQMLGLVGRMPTIEQHLSDLLSEVRKVIKSTGSSYYVAIR